VSLLASFCRSGRWPRPVGANGPSYRRSGFGGSRRRNSIRLNHRQRPADRDLVARVALELDDFARYRRGQLHRRFLGEHVDQRLFFLDDVADLHVPVGDLGLGDAFADVGELEDV
jgi:hypothetical protein